ncbi:MAG: hypothetical protein J0L77_01125 [Alphaproteobacteria bacterium]|nr:hypothetical protein [Alphaproteobacteria bacterium]
MSDQKKNSSFKKLTAKERKEKLEAIIPDIKKLAVEYYRLTGKPLGVTGEIAELTAAKILKLELATARTKGYDAIRRSTTGKEERIQIKGRALEKKPKSGQRLSRIKTNAPCDYVQFVELDISTFDLRGIWEAPYKKIVELLERPGSSARAKGALGLQTFKKNAVQIWPKK